jgi:hypothetical protein
MYSELAEIVRVFSYIVFGWGVGFVSFAVIDFFRISKEIKENKVRHDIEMARIKAARSVTR